MTRHAQLSHRAESLTVFWKNLSREARFKEHRIQRLSHLVLFCFLLLKSLHLSASPPLLLPSLRTLPSSSVFIFLPLPPNQEFLEKSGSARFLQGCQVYAQLEPEDIVHSNENNFYLALTTEKSLLLMDYAAYKILRFHAGQTCRHRAHTTLPLPFPPHAPVVQVFTP